MKNENSGTACRVEAGVECDWEGPGELRGGGDALCLDRGYQYIFL